MLENYMPYDQISPTNPIFRYAVRGLRWGGTPGALMGSTRRRVAFAFGMLGGLWLLVVFERLLSGACAGSYWCVQDGSSTFLGFLAIGSIGVGILLDFACMIASAHTIGSEFTAGRWDLLRLTPLRETAIIDAHYGLAQVRAWRMMSSVIGIRVTFIALGLAHIFVLPYFIRFLTSSYVDDPFEGLARSFRYDFGGTLLLLIVLMIFFAVYVIEPLWRMRAMTALGMAISARFRSVVTAGLTSLGAIVGVWILQAIIMGIIFFVLSRMASGINSMLMGMCVVLFFCIGTAFIIYYFYYNLREWSLGRAVRYAFFDNRVWEG